MRYESPCFTTPPHLVVLALGCALGCGLGALAARLLPPMRPPLRAASAASVGSSASSRAKAQAERAEARNGKSQAWWETEGKNHGRLAEIGEKMGIVAETLGL